MQKNVGDYERGQGKEQAQMISSAASGARRRAGETEISEVQPH